MSSIYIYSADTKWTKGDLYGAISDLTRSIDFNSNNSVAYYKRGYAKVRNNDIKGALYDYNKAIDIDPNNNLIYINRGEC